MRKRSLHDNKILDDIENRQCEFYYCFRASLSHSLIDAINVVVSGDSVTSQPVTVDASRLSRFSRPSFVRETQRDRHADVSDSRGAYSPLLLFDAKL